MTRVLHVLDHSLPMQSGYSFRTRAIMRAQIAEGWEARGITGQRHTEGGPIVESADGLTFYRTKAVRRGGPFGIAELREVDAFSSSIEAAIRSWQPRILHVHSPVLNALAAFRAARRYRIPLVYEIRAFWEDAAVGNGTGAAKGLRYRLVRALETCAVRRAAAVVVICEGLRDALLARGIDPAKLTVVPNGVDMDQFGDPVPPDPGLRAQLGLDGAEVAAFIGSFYDYEGLDDLIAAMPALVARRPNARLLLVGGGPCEAALRRQAAASPAAHAIRFAGRVPHDAVEQYYALADMLVYPRKAMRLTELVTPLKPLEAMAQGRLVAASSVGGHRELIEDGVTGTLFPPGDPAAMAGALADLLDRRDQWGERRAAARAYIDRERNWADLVKRYRAVYRHLLKGSDGIPMDSMDLPAREQP